MSVEQVTHEIGVDVGGTFTDIVCRSSDGRVRIMKLPSTRSDPSRAILNSIGAMADQWGIKAGDITRFTHGTTVATNAVLEHKGASIGLLTTAGFRDVLEIGRQIRSGDQMYAVRLKPETPVFLARRAHRLGVKERIGPHGEVLVPLDRASLVEAIDTLAAKGVQAIAVAFLFSFLNPAHELAAAEEVRARHPHIAVSLSHAVDPAFREYERTVVTAFDAYIRPVIDSYLARLETGLRDNAVTAPLQIMQSRGGLAIAAVARERPVRLFLSGPAAGVIGGRLVGDQLDIQDLITVDIGGTSCDIALIGGGKPMIRSEGVIGGYAVRVGMVDVNTIGSGGGSIARLDRAKGLRVGPQSAGSEPGPACYARGGLDPTVTDASIVLGYLDPDYFAGGTVRLNSELARQAVADRIAGPLGLTLEQAALGIHRVLNAQMAEGIRLVSVRQGIDPRRFALLPLGGGGAIHATALAEELAIERIIVPRHPGVLSAAGLLAAKVEHERSAAFARTIDGLTMAAIRPALNLLDHDCAKLMAVEGMPPDAVTIQYSADICYVGQSYTLEVPLHPNAPNPLTRLYDDFIAAHDRVYGFAMRNPARIVNLRSVHQAGGGDQLDEQVMLPTGPLVVKSRRRALFRNSGGYVDTPVIERTAIPLDVVVEGPAIIEQQDTTLLIDPGWQGRLAPNGTLILTRSSAQTSA